MSGNATRIVFVTDADLLGTNPGGEFQLYSYNILTSDLAQITTVSATGLYSLFDFDLTDNGGSVVWASADDVVAGGNPNGRPNVYISATDGSTVSQVTSVDSFFAINPVISGNGSVVAFLSEADLEAGSNPNNEMRIFRVNVDGSGLAQVSGDGVIPTSISLSNDGSTIAFEGVGDPVAMNADGSREIFVINTDGSGLTQVSMSDSDSFEPKISGDGSLVVFSSRGDLTGGNSDGNYEVFVVNSDGMGTLQISDGDADSGTFQSGAPGEYDISGNSSVVVFSSEANLTGENASLEHTLFWSPASGGVVSQVLRDSTVAAGAIDRTAEKPTVSNDGSGIAFEAFGNLTSFDQPPFEKIYTTVIQ